MWRSKRPSGLRYRPSSHNTSGLNLAWGLWCMTCLPNSLVLCFLSFTAVKLFSKGKTCQNIPTPAPLRTTLGQTSISVFYVSLYHALMKVWIYPFSCSSTYIANNNIYNKKTLREISQIDFVVDICNQLTVLSLDNGNIFMHCHCIICEPNNICMNKIITFCPIFIIRHCSD